MSPKAVAQAKERLERAKEAIVRLREAGQDFASTERAWSEFLLSASTVYSKLEQGSKADGRSESWFGRKKGERRDDPLLSYLHHARNSDEHSIEEVTTRERAGVGFDMPDEPYAFEIERVLPNGTPIIKNLMPGGALPEFRSYPGRLRAITVHDRRYGDSFAPPDLHLGTAINSHDPTVLASLAFGYLERMVEEAEALVTL